MSPMHSQSPSHRASAPRRARIAAAIDAGIRVVAIDDHLATAAHRRFHRASLGGRARASAGERLRDRRARRMRSSDRRTRIDRERACRRGASTSCCVAPNTISSVEMTTVVRRRVRPRAVTSAPSSSPNVTRRALRTVLLARAARDADRRREAHDRSGRFTQAHPDLRLRFRDAIASVVPSSSMCAVPALTTTATSGSAILRQVFDLSERRACPSRSRRTCGTSAARAA